MSTLYSTRVLTKDLPAFVKGFEDYVSKGIEVYFVSRHVPFFEHKRFGANVINASFDTAFSKKMTEASSEMFRSGFGSYFSMQDQGRGDIIGDGPLLSALTSNGSIDPLKLSKNERTIPTLTCGFSNMDANRYRFNRYNILGGTRPFLVGTSMSSTCKKAYLDFLKVSMECPISKGAFSLENLSKEEQTIRKSLLSEFFCAFASDVNEPHEWLTNESNADLCVDQLTPHLDKQNSTIDGLDTVLGFSCHPPISSLREGQNNESSLKIGIDSKPKTNFKLLDYVIGKGYVNTFPHTHVKYMKSIVDSYVKKRVALNSLAEKDTLRKLFVWGLHETMNTYYDYRGSIFDNDKFLDNFKQESVEFNEPGSLLQGSHLRVKPSFDKMGHYSSILEIWNIFVVDFLPSPNVINAIDYAFYTVVTCNGMSLPWRVSLEIHKNKSTSFDLFKTLGSLFKFLKKMDAKALVVQKGEKPSTKRGVGHSTDNQSSPSYIAQETDWDQHSVTVLLAINVAYYNGSIELLDEEFHEFATENKGRPLLENVICSFRGISDFFCNCLISVLSLMGVVPLSEYQHGTISSQWSSTTGPVMLANACLTEAQKENKNPNEIYESLKNDLNSTIGANYFTGAFGDNMGCEVWRTYCDKLDKMGESHKTIRKHKCELVMDDSIPGSSDKSDMYFYMPQKHAVQNVYLYVNNARGFTASRPGLLVRSSLAWDQGPMILTDYSGQTSAEDNNSKNLIYWKKKPKEGFKCQTVLVVTKRMKNLYHPPTIRPVRQKKSPNRFQDELKYRSERSDDFKNSVCNFE